MSEGRKEHRRKILAANAREGQAARIRDQLESIDKQKKEAVARKAAEEAAKKEALDRKLAAAAKELARARKVFVAGDPRGNLPKLLTTVEQQVAKVGAFDMLLCVGDFLSGGDDATGFAGYATGEKQAPLEVYFVDAGAALIHAAPQGRKLCENIQFLGGYGVRELNGLRVAFLSGRYNPETYDKDDVDFVGDSFTSRAVSELRKIVLEDRKQRGIDILLTCGWPSDIDANIGDDAEKKPPVLEDGTPWQKACARPLAELAHAIEPRYHLFGTADVFYQRPPFLVPQRQHICRCIGLGNVGSSGKQRKWLHALSLAPMRGMKQEDLRQSPPNITACPFGGQKRGGSDIQEPPAKRRAVEQDKDLLEKAMAALQAGDIATYESFQDKLQTAVLSSGSAMKEKKEKVDPEAEAAAAAAPQKTELNAPEKVERELTPAELMRAEAASDWLKKAPLKGVVRYKFDLAGPLGIRLSRDIPPWVLEVRDGTLAARKEPKVPVGGVVIAVNGYELKLAGNAAATEGLGRRPVVLDVEWPVDQPMPNVTRA